MQKRQKCSFGGGDMAQGTVVNRPGRRKVLGVYFRNNWQLYLLLLIPVVFVIVFK
jgi:hypothetical protein